MVFRLQAYPQEKVGVFVRRGKGGPLTVVEYSELDPSMASLINQQTGRLRFCWSNVMSIITCFHLLLLACEIVLYILLIYMFALLSHTLFFFLSYNIQALTALCFLGVLTHVYFGFPKPSGKWS